VPKTNRTQLEALASKRSLSKAVPFLEGVLLKRILKAVDPDKNPAPGFR